MMNWKQTVELYIQVGHCFTPAAPGENLNLYIRHSINRMQLSERSDLLCGLFSKEEMDKIKVLGSDGIINNIAEAMLRNHVIESFEFIRGLCNG